MCGQAGQGHGCIDYVRGQQACGHVLMLMDASLLLPSEYVDESGSAGHLPAWNVQSRAMTMA